MKIVVLYLALGCQVVDAVRGGVGGVVLLAMLLFVSLPRSAVTFQVTRLPAPITD